MVNREKIYRNTLWIDVLRLKEGPKLELTTFQDIIDQSISKVQKELKGTWLTVG